MSEPLSAERLAEIRARAEEAMPGPWGAWRQHQPNGPDLFGVQSRLLVDLFSDAGITVSDVEFIAAARQDIPDLLAEVDRLRAENADLRENPRDEYHTMDDLYEYRMLYNALAANGLAINGVPVVKSWVHSDGEPCFGGGWFIVVMTLPTGQVSNHYKAEHWDLFRVPECLPPAYDGHTPQDAADRLRATLVLPPDRPAMRVSRWFSAAHDERHGTDPAWDGIES